MFESFDRFGLAIATCRPLLKWWRYMFCSETPLKVADVLSTMSRPRVGGCVNIDIDVLVFAASELAASTLRGRSDDFNCRNEITRQLIIPLANAKTGWDGSMTGPWSQGPHFSSNLLKCEISACRMQRSPILVA